MNNVSLIGRLTRDPELRYTQQGTAVVRITVAVDRRMSKERKMEAQAANQQTADFINCTAWRNQAELIANYFKKGNRIGITGRIQTGSYEKDGQTIYTTDVICEGIDFIESANSQNTSGQMRRPQAQNQGFDQPVNSAYSNDFNNSQNDQSDDGFFPIDNDDIPF